LQAIQPISERVLEDFTVQSNKKKPNNGYHHRKTKKLRQAMV
jgi:hypothetical protein